MLQSSLIKRKIFSFNFFPPGVVTVAYLGNSEYFLKQKVRKWRPAVLPKHLSHSTEKRKWRAKNLLSFDVSSIAFGATAESQCSFENWSIFHYFLYKWFFRRLPLCPSSSVVACVPGVPKGDGSKLSRVVQLFKFVFKAITLPILLNFSNLDNSAF